jgi:hypothetical protein
VTRDQDVLDPRRAPRYTSARGFRDTPVRQRRPMPERRRPSRRHGNGPLLVAGLLVVAALGGVAAVRTLSGPDLQGALIGQGDGGAPGGGPRMSIPKEIVPSVPGFVNTLRGFTDGAVSLTANGDPVELDAGGGFTVHLPQAWTDVRLEATDAAGRRNEQVVTITPNPTPVEHPSTMAVHARFQDWALPEVRERIIAMAQTGQINAVQLDIKDETGQVGYETKVRLARRVSASTTYYDARATVDELHGLGVRVIGRIVNFLDPVLAKWAWENGRPEMIVLDGSGSEPLANDYGAAAFTNFANPTVRKYQIDLAREAVKLGFDEILYDYIRRPEGDLETMQFPGLEMPPDVSIARFVDDTGKALDGTGARLGVSIFGVSARFPQDTAQDSRLLAPLVDYISPMVYPALWGSGQYGVENPVRQPAEIVTASLTDFEKLAAGTGAVVVPWLQAYSSRNIAYGPAEVHAQIDAAVATGSDGYLLWNAASRYDPAMLKPV